MERITLQQIRSAEYPRGMLSPKPRSSYRTFGNFFLIVLMVLLIVRLVDLALPLDTGAIPFAWAALIVGSSALAAIIHLTCDIWLSRRYSPRRQAWFRNTRTFLLAPTWIATLLLGVFLGSATTEVGAQLSTISFFALFLCWMAPLATYETARNLEREQLLEVVNLTVDKRLAEVATELTATSLSSRVHAGEPPTRGRDSNGSRGGVERLRRRGLISAGLALALIVGWRSLRT